MSADAFRILSFTTVYPNPAEPALGTFVRTRLQAVAALPGVLAQVVAPVPLINYSRLRAGRLGASRIPPLLRDKLLDVSHPRWLYPPAYGRWNASLLAGQSFQHVARLRPFDVIDAHFGYPDGVAASILAERLSCPYTVTLRGSEVDHALNPNIRGQIARALCRAARVIPVSRRLADFASTLGVSRQRISVIPNGVDTSVFFPRDRDAIRQSLGVPPEGSLILSAGHLIELKGHHHIIEAVRLLAGQGIQATLIVAGGPGKAADYSAELRLAASRLGLPGSISFTGHVSPGRLAELMTAADVFCLASRREGWPNVVHEALACGTPVVAADVGAVPDLIPDSRYGAVVEHPIAAQLAQALGQALKTRWDRPAISAWGSARSWNQVAAETLEVLREAAQTP